MFTWLQILRLGEGVVLRGAGRHSECTVVRIRPDGTHGTFTQTFLRQGKLLSESP